MATIQCARCGATEDERSAAYSSDGLVCAACHEGDVEKDAEQMREAERDSGRLAHELGRGSPAALGIVLGASSSVTRSEARRPAGAGTTALHEELRARGIAFRRATVSGAVTVAGNVASSTSGYREEWSLPSAPAVQASFSQEGLVAKLGKLFTRELQTGDARFDDAVYVRTSTPDATAALLSDPAVRALVGDVVAGGGSFAIRGTGVEGTAVWPDDEPGDRPDDLVARLVAALVR